MVVANIEFIVERELGAPHRRAQRLSAHEIGATDHGGREAFEE